MLHDLTPNRHPVAIRASGRMAAICWSGYKVANWLDAAVGNARLRAAGSGEILLIASGLLVLMGSDVVRRGQE